MKDRIPTKPGRIALTDEETGVTKYYIMTMADEPVEDGTDLNKAALLQDATAAAFGLTDSAVPDDVFAALAQNRARVTYGEYTGTGTYGSSNAVTLNFPFEPKIVVVLSEDSSYFGTSGSGNTYSSWLMAIHGITKCFVGYYYNNEVVVSWSGDSISYYTESASPGAQCNVLNKKYYYVAIG